MIRLGLYARWALLLSAILGATAGVITAMYTG